MEKQLKDMFEKTIMGYSELLQEDDLMKGNFIYNNKKVPICVNSICDGIVETQYGLSDTYEIGMCLPIPITFDFIKDYGWGKTKSKHGYNVYYLEDIFLREMNIGGINGYLVYKGINIEEIDNIDNFAIVFHMHELQNIFYLTKKYHFTLK